jgi:hypothetical protein
LARPDDLGVLLAEQIQFETFFPLRAAKKKGIVAIAGSLEIPTALRKFPLFRERGGISRDGKVLNWWLWDGNEEWRIGELNEHQKTYPIRGIVNDTLLIDRIETGWKSTDEVRNPASE